MARYVAGVDGCRGGWLVVLRTLDDPSSATAFMAASFADVLASHPTPEVIAIDIPIGLAALGAAGGRSCDTAARRVLGGRQSSVFAIPARAAVMSDDYGVACAIAHATSDPPRKVSKQAFNLFPKIREVDALMTPGLQHRVFECHPEAAFWALNGQQPLREPKKVKSLPYAEGLALRQRLLVGAGYNAKLFEGPHAFGRVAGRDDLLDASACSWSAARIARQVAHRFPASPPDVDARGLRMEIWA